LIQSKFGPLHLKDPVSGLTHLLGALLGMAALTYLINLGVESQDPRRIVSGAVFGTSLVLLYLSSACYHLIPVPEHWNRWFRRIDHCMIFLLIAGSYTPFCLLALWSTVGLRLLITVWAFAVLGFAMSLWWIEAPRWISTLVYLVMGWLAVTALSPLLEALTGECFRWLVIGGIFYTVGAIVYGIKRPDPFPKVFGFHEIWHCFVLAGSASHFVSIAALMA
jgi:hemolysin III